MQEGETLRREICQRIVALPDAGADLAALGSGTFVAKPAAAPSSAAVWLLPVVAVLALLLLVWRVGRGRRA